MDRGSLTSRRAAYALLAGVWFALSGAPAGASTGVGVDARPIQLARAIPPGHTYPLPGLYVVNTGTTASSYEVRLQRLSRGPSHAVPAAWVTFGRTGVALASKQSTVVPLTLRLPANAPSGAYLAYLVAAAKTPGALGVASLGAAAATELRFTVSAPGSASVLDDLWRPPWSYVWLCVGGLLALFGFFRITGLRLRVERRR